jgi:hypothetical protein
MNKPKYSVVLSSSYGQMDAITSSNQDYVNKIVSDLNEAIIERG